MSAGKFPPLVVFVLSVILMVLLVAGAAGQATAPPESTSRDSTHPSPQIPRPRPPTHKDVAKLKAVMNWPDSILTGIGIVGHFAEASFLKASESTSMLATNTTGVWVKINQAEGSYTDDDIVRALPGISSSEAVDLSVQTTLSRVRWAKADKSPEPKANVALFNKYQAEGNAAALYGDFDLAIAAWTKAETLDPGDVKACRGESQRVQIRAAEDAKARMERLHLTKEEAADWFWKNEGELWMYNCCDLP